ncbi:hypothetical protein [Demequina sp. NBRC 110057]|uniref:hypothetical protein n=1 Tax=Demequina sp. NBRC 110057 TaxID=1570346 RepID=UPI000A033095|nr:hypothetical protein [Demequina sp. NBRC 110057]
MHKGLMVVGAIAVAGASAAVGWYGVKWLVQPEASAEPGTSPVSASTVSLSYDLDSIEEQAAGLFEPPACGETWTADAASANGVSVAANVDTTDGSATASVSFTVDSSDITAFLAQQGQLIVTRDDVVVTPDWGSEFVPQLFMATSETPAAGSSTYDITGASLCDVAGELSALWDDFDWDNATDEEIAARYDEVAAFEDEHATLPAGEYKVYAWSPIIQGTSAAVARVLTEEGLTDLSLLQYTAGYSSISDDERIAPYCEESETPDGNTEKLCDVPQDVLTEVLTRDVPESYVTDAEPTVAISEAFSFTVE